MNDATDDYAAGRADAFREIEEERAAFHRLIAQDEQDERRHHREMRLVLSATVAVSLLSIFMPVIRRFL